MTTTFVTPQVSGLYAAVPTIEARGTHEAHEMVIMGSAAIATTSLASGDIILLDRVPWDAKIIGISLMADQLDTNSTPTLAYEVGLYTVSSNAGTVATAAVGCYATGVTIGQSASYTGSNLAFSARALSTLVQPCNRVMDDANITGRPGDGLMAVLGLTITTAAATAATGNMGYIIRYTM